MTDFPPRARLRWAVGLAGVVLIGAAVRLPDLSAPLLEGAAGKQTHTAMVARNLYRGRASLARPRVDDVGEPGYFVKELPLVPAAAALFYRVRGEVDERGLRAIGIAAWLAGAPLLATVLRSPLGGATALAAALWFVLSPMAIVYSRAAMNDAVAVTASLGALAVVARWRVAPGGGTAAAAGLAVLVSFLLKPHTAFWLGPAAALLALSPQGAAGRDRPRLRDVALLAGAAAAGLAIASLWYLHAAAVHRAHPVPGATVPEGWIDLGLLARPDLYAEIARQTAMMVLTPVGAALAVLGALRGPAFSAIERALLLWGAGVWLQCLVFAPRMFDDLSRGTEYYQLPMVATAAALVARGLADVDRRSRAALRRGGGAVAAVVLVALAAGALVQTALAMRVPARYDAVLADCARIREITRPDDELVVLADRGGTILYYCDRRGQTFSLGGAVNETIAKTSMRASAFEISQALARARYLYVPFPDLVGEDSGVLDAFARGWTEVPLPGSDARLFAKPGTPHGRTP